MTRRKNPYAGADARTVQAKRAGYPARSVFKLQEIDRRMQLLKPGQRVLDLGAAPGSWSLYAGQRVGERGRVVAVDLSPIQQQFGANVTVLQADVFTLPESELSALGPFDVVLSDMAPSTSGSKVRDQALSFELFMKALAVALATGAPRSRFVGKLFMSEDFTTARAALAARYAEVRVIRPEGTRQQSSEVFLVGKGLTPSAT